MTNSEKATKRAHAIAPKITKRQTDFLLNLLNELGFGTRLKQLDFLSNYVEHPVTSIDTITLNEASCVIDNLLARRSA